MDNTSIGFIGGGNMASSLIGGLINDGWPAQQIHVAEPATEQREQLSSRFGVHTGDSNIDIAAQVDLLVLAVKPQAMHSVCNEIANAVHQSQPLLISIAAGIRLQTLSAWLDNYAQLIRAMPNTPALVQSGATALVADNAVSTAQRDQAETIMRAVGLTLWLENEQQMDAVTAVSGSGPAYFFRVMEAMEQAAVNMGLPGETAHLLTIQTAFGAAKMALESTDKPNTLREKVTSPGGTTERALAVLEDGGLGELFEQALQAARDRSNELATLLEQNT